MTQQIAIISPIGLPACQADAEIAAAMGFAEMEKSEGTLLAYRSDWRIFAAWCLARGLACAAERNRKAA